MLPYIVTIFLSAFLLFQVQPIIAKIILPWFGGSAAVWTTCLMFFQMALLLGYLYSHWSIQRLQPKAQTSVHLTLLCVSLLFLPFITSDRWKPENIDPPILKITLLLLITVGLPFFLLSTTSSMLQAWYVRTSETHRNPVYDPQAQPGDKEGSPYRLYAVSNAGSLLALLSYPVLVEPVFPTRLQAYIWSGTYLLFALLCGVVAWRAREAPSAPGTSTLNNDPQDVRAEAEGEALAVVQTEAEVKAPGLGMHLLWMSLVACSTILLLAITTHLTQNVAPVPLLWVLPLSLYLLSFILTFGARRWEWNRYQLAWPPLVLGALAIGSSFKYKNLDLQYLFPVFLIGLFGCCMICHGELARTKPHPKHLTSYYLMMSVGGAVGGLFVGLLAPTLFNDYYELPLGFILVGLLVWLRLYSHPVKGWRAPLWFVGGILFALMVHHLFKNTYDMTQRFKLSVRDFYGVLRVYGLENKGTGEKRKVFLHGTIEHGLQITHPPFLRREPITYYAPYSGVGMAFNKIKGPKRVGIIGLGTGTMTVYSQPGDTFRFYEISPLVVEIARKEFTYLDDAPGKVEVILGDARISMEQEPPQNYDLLAVDAFSGDAIPAHLLTREAFQLYFRHLKPGGVLAVHVSNRHLDLAAVVERVATSLGKPSRVVDSPEDEERVIYNSVWTLVTDKPGYFNEEPLSLVAEPIPPRPGLRVWTDDYSNLFQIIK